MRTAYLLPLVLALSCAGCASAPPPLAPHAVLTPGPALTDPAARRKAIRAELAKLCPATLTAAELDDLASFVEAHPEALAWANRLDQFDQESRACRGEIREGMT